MTMAVQIEDLNTNKLFINIKDPDYVEQFYKLSDVFKVKTEVNHKKLFRFIPLMYDPNSELRKNISSLPQRKMIAAMASGFLIEKDNKFSKTTEDAICGADAKVARMVAEYCMFSAGMDFTVLTTYYRIFTEVTTLSSTHKDYNLKDIVTLISKLRAEIESLEGKILGGDEVQLMRKALYTTSKTLSLGLQIEDIVDRLAKGDNLEDFSPYPNNYVPNKLTYAGEGSPEVD